MNHGALVRPALVAASVLALGAVAAAGVASPMRPLLTVWFLLFCPGLALAPLLRLGDGWNQLAVAIPLSIALDILVASAFLYAGAWSAPRIVAVLAGISLLGAALEVRGWRVSR